MSERALNFLFASTLFYLVTVSPFCFLWIFKDNFTKTESISVEEARNERSTPRSFILPANPAVAAEQQRKKMILKDRENIQRCVINLVDKGYKLANVEMITSDDVVFETIRYQLDIGIQPTGTFDKTTRLNLLC